MLPLIILVVFVVGAVITYALDGWLDWSEGDIDYLLFFTWVWPLAIWFILAEALRQAIGNIKRKREQRQEEEQRFRIAAQKELKQYEEELEEYIAQHKMPVRSARSCHQIKK